VETREAQQPVAWSDQARLRYDILIVKLGSVSIRVVVLVELVMDPSPLVTLLYASLTESTYLSLV